MEIDIRITANSVDTIRFADGGMHQNTMALSIDGLTIYDVYGDLVVIEYCDIDNLIVALEKVREIRGG